jgi:GNAT superfamily N-acetyltransferase
MWLENQSHRQIDFRPAVENDIDFLYTLHVATMKEYVDKIWGWDDAFQESNFRKNYVPAEIQIVMLDGEEIGMISLEHKVDEIFLRIIEIRPGYQRQGLGTAIIHTIINDATRQKKPVSLRVLKANPAKRLYERLGFRTIEETLTHYIMKTS